MASHSPRQPYEYLDVLLNAIPYDSVPPEIASPARNESVNPNPYLKFIDTALRLVCGGPARSDDSPPLRDAWPEIQPSVQSTLHALHPSSQPPTKRKHSPPPSIANKKPKHGVDETTGATEIKNGNDDDDDDNDDAPHLTLHALSATAPVRHKVDITLHERTLRLAHSTTNAASGLCTRAALTRAFLLPTRARSSGAPQWTVLLLTGDKPTPPASLGRGSAGSSTAAAAAAGAASVRFERFELAGSVLDKFVPRLTVHPPTSTSTSTSVTSAFEVPSLPKNSSREVLLAFLSSTIRDTPVTLTTVERGTPLAGITAFRGVKETSLWFFDGAGGVAGAGAGVLADARPAEFWALADLAPGEAGVRVRTATGRTCSVVLMRRRASADAGGNNGEEDDEEVEEEGEETEFQMIDGKERERILEWVRKHRGAFGKPEKGLHHEEAQGTTVAAAAAAEGEGRGKGKGKGTDGEQQQIGEARGDSDADDSDFEVESGESDGGSPSSSSNSSGSESDWDSGRAEKREAGSGSGSGSGSGGEEAEVDSDAGEERSSGRAQIHDDGDDGDIGGDDDDEDDNEVVELDPKYHPLLRAGALPKMSRAAMDAAVELVVGDLVGKARPGPELGSPNGQKEYGHEDEGDDEEDELDD